ncbi:hypothetical protein [Pseudomonas sp. UMAB-40]|uniref:hypothetical protein n=1 Tax=Pseudomonas sp. UMAB-40 TaxID=1365407 RepID=UPI001C562919|nr:hypothetical protein [Pseudomonas sp. UMAB-40]
MANDQMSERETQLSQAFSLGAQVSEELQAEQLAQDFRERYAADPQLVEHFELGRTATQSDRVFMGLLKEHGHAKYQHDPKENSSYYVTLVTPAGEKTVWGIDLKRALAVDGLKAGDPVRLEYKGSVAVQVVAPKKDAHGAIIGHETITTNRNTWEAHKWESPVQSAVAGSSMARAGGRAPQPLAAGGAAPAVGRPLLSMAQSFMLGAKGLAGLKSMLNTGGDTVNSAVSDFRVEKPELELKNVLDVAAEHVSSLKSAGVVPSDGTLSADEHKALIQDILKTPSNKQSLDKLVSSLDRAVLLSGSVVEKGVGAGLDEAALNERAVDPLKRFMSEHESVLKSLQHDDQSLLERMQQGVDRLVSMLSQMLDRLFSATGIRSGSGAADRAGPKLGA